MNRFQIVQWVFVIAVFVMVFITVWKTLRETSSFQNAIAAVLAFCVSVLCAAGIVQFIELPGSGFHDEASRVDPRNPLYYILLPYVALAVAVLMAQLLVLTGKILPETKSKPRATQTKTAMKTKTGKRRGRPRKKRPEEGLRENPAVNTEGGGEARPGSSCDERGLTEDEHENGVAELA